MKLFVFAFLILFGSRSLAQMPGSWEMQTLCDTCESPISMTFFDAKHGVIILESSVNGHADSNQWQVTTLWTSDGGATWITSTDTVSDAGGLRSTATVFASMVSETDLVLLTNSVLHHTADKGLSYAVKRSDLRFELGSTFLAPSLWVRFSGPYASFITNAERTLSHDLGESFTDTSHLVLDSTLSFYRAFVRDSLEIWVRPLLKGPVDGKYPVVPLIMTSNGGRTWYERWPFEHHPGMDDGNTSVGLNLIFGKSSGTALALGGFYPDHNGRTVSADVMITHDYGETWYIDTSRPLGAARYSSHAVLASDDHVWIASSKNALGFSSDGGRSWSYDSSTIPKDMEVIAMCWPDTLHGYIVTYAKPKLSLSGSIALWRFVPYSSSVEHHEWKTSMHFLIRPTIVESGSLTLQARQPIAGVISVNDVLGRTYIVRQLEIAKRGEVSVDVSMLPSGAYLLSYQDRAGGVRSARFLKR